VAHISHEKISMFERKPMFIFWELKRPITYHANPVFNRILNLFHVDIWKMMNGRPNLEH
jgi:hypothetical protein